MLKAIFLGNSACCLTDGMTSVLLDAPNGLHTVFDAVSEADFGAITDKLPPFDLLKGVLFSHRHSDHYDKKRLRILQDAFPDLLVLSPSGASAPNGTLAVGSFRAEYASVPHSGAEFADVPHVVYWLTAGNKSIYFSGDAIWDREAHLSVWKGRTPDVGIWNPNFINHSDSRELMQKCEINILCHLPNHSEDVLGIGRKARSSIAKYGNTIPNLICVTEYPMTVDL